MALTVWLFINVALLVSIGFFSKQKPNGMASTNRASDSGYFCAFIVVLCRVRHPVLHRVDSGGGLSSKPCHRHLHGRPSACHGRAFSIYFIAERRTGKSPSMLPTGFGIWLVGLFIGR